MTIHDKRKLGSSGVSFAPIIMGAWQAGGEYWTGIDDDESVRALRAAVEAGIDAFDTAEEYGAGHSEAIVGRALREVRDRVVLLTKVWSANLRRDDLVAACERSLQRLGTDRIDVYQVHWPSGSWGTDAVPVEETVAGLQALKAAGKIRAIGVSNFTLEQLREFHALQPVDSLQPPYSLFWRHIEAEIRPFCVAHGIAVLAYSPLAQGLLTGRFAAGHRFDAGDPRADNKLFQPAHWPRVAAALDQLRAIAARKGCTMAQLALAWTIAQPLTSAIVGARSVEQVRDNAAAMRVELTADEVAAIDAIGAPVAAPFLDDPVLWTWQP